MSSHNFNIRPATLDDIPALLELEIQVWGGNMGFNRMQLEQLLINHPIGNLVSILPDGEICAYMAFCFLDFNKMKADKICSWYGLSGNGTASTHTAEGPDCFGINLSVIYKAPKEVAFSMLEETRNISRKFGIKRVVLGSRIPGYYRYAHKMSPEEYWKAERKYGVVLDPQLFLYKRYGFQPIELVENYFQDPKSLNFGVIMEKAT